MKRLKHCVLIGLFCLTVNLVCSQNRTDIPKNVYLNYLETLYEKGRQCYINIGNKAQLERIIDEYETAIKEGESQGILSQNDRDSLMLDVKQNKLRGDYHYLNTDENRHSYKKAENYFKKALAIAEAQYYTTLSSYYQFALHEELGQLYYKLERYEDACHEMEEAYQFHTSYIDSDSKALDYISQLAICKARTATTKKEFEDALRDINQAIKDYPDKKSEPYGEALRKKAKILMLQQESGLTGMDDPTERALKCYKEYFVLKKADALKNLGSMNPEDREHYWMRVRPFVTDCYRTEAADPAFLYNVTLFGKSLLLEYAQSGKSQLFTWQDVQQKLQATDCAVEFIQYEKYGEKQMGALVLKKQGEPKFVKIGKEKDLEDLPLEGGGYLFDAVTHKNGGMKNRLYNDSSNFISIWTPELLNAIGKETQRLYFAADGLFHVLAIEYMLPNAPELTSLKTENLYRLSSTRQLLVKKNKKKNSKILLCGGINFYANTTTTLDEANYTNDEQTYVFLRRLEYFFDTLTGTVTEINGIRNAYDNRCITMLTDTCATEARAVYLIPKHDIVHLATHGFFESFSSKSTDLRPVCYDETLSQSGVTFAGCTKALDAPKFNATQYDGLLSAREIAHMDFSNVDLMVLSACQTGLGIITDDGVYGLQRGLKNAGVRSMILSLWSVDDDATSFLMQAFYKNLLTEDTHDAFVHAREELIHTVRDLPQEYDPETMTEKEIKYFDLPYYCNAFILIDVK